MSQQAPLPPAAPAPPGAPLAQTSVTQAIELVQAQIAGLKKEVADLTAQLTPGTSRIREQVIEQQVDQANSRLEQLQGQLDRLISGEPVALVEVGVPPSEQTIPREVVGIIEMVLVSAVVIALGFPLVRTIARRFDRRPVAEPGAEMSGRFDRLEQAVDAVAIEVERISEGQRYTSRQLGELRALPQPAPVEAWPAAREGAHQELKR